MIKIIRDRFSDDVDHFTDSELAYIVGYERIPMDQLCESETLWKLRSWGKYEDYLDAAELIFDEDEYCDIFNEDFYKELDKNYEEEDDAVDEFDFDENTFLQDVE